ncbi:MAG: poly-beta-hydroxybutyrate polymerase, partial [Actinomycetota bacterium]|nr:poly-beta-hydroxybutyrate polymerase [Actinomycetota bacterium]
MTDTADSGSRQRRPPHGAWSEQLEDAVDAATRSLPGADLLGQFDPASFGAAIGRLGQRLATSPTGTASALTRYVGGLMHATTVGALRALGQDVEGPVSPGKDKRFADPTWEQNAWYYVLRQQHLLLERFVAELFDVADLDDAGRAKAEFLVRQLVDAAAPTNTLVGNPAALKKAFETGGRSLVRGSQNFARDLVQNRGQPRQTVPGQFVVGRDLAATPGKVVFRNDLMELLQYSPQTDQVREIPLLFSPPWINKYYMMDLAPGRSLVEWAVGHGLTVFAISYRNPDETMRHIRFDDYLVSGPRQAIDVIQDITGAESVNVIGLCLGGTLTMATLAYLANVGDRRVRTATLLNTLIDFTEPGALGVFTDEATVERLER